MICEKPVEIALDRIDRMIEACRSHGVQLACVLNNAITPCTAASTNAFKAGSWAA